eukprot:TRINITY_DN44542_c0_g1_i1.p1 TRINITY_DN44542_c0_g1~~TRINITY_DN44542_c0_g1_i1.p1  ORF type:complete len:547 (+),score=81.75 TRINITY_DN44542_c0_g1_i1:58-1698(+)
MQRPPKVVPLEDVEFNIEDSRVQEELVSMIIQYLGDIGYTYSMMTLRDEAKLKEIKAAAARKMVTQMRNALLDGDWPAVEQLCRKPLFKNHPTFIYAVAKQQYLELLEGGDGAKALSFLQQRLQSIERPAATATTAAAADAETADLKELCYLLTVADSSAVTRAALAGKKNLVELFEQLFLDDRRVPTAPVLAAVPPNHLITCLKEAYAYQATTQPQLPEDNGPIIINSVLTDYFVPLIPCGCRAVLPVPGGSVKCIAFVGPEGTALAAGAGDGGVHVWTDCTASADASTFRFDAHAGRVWSLAGRGTQIASGGADGSVALWDYSECKRVSALYGHRGDIYSVIFHPSLYQLASGGVDRTVRLWEPELQREIARFHCHTAAVTALQFNDTGSILVSGSNDGTVKFIDPAFGMETSCYTIDSYCCDVSSLEFDHSGWYLLVSYKDSTNRIWDVRTGKCLPLRLKGHRNATKNFVRSCFGSGGTVVHGGSEDGSVHTWNARSGAPLVQLGGHLGTVYDVKWSPSLGILASSGNDGRVRLWETEPRSLA